MLNVCVQGDIQVESLYFCLMLVVFGLDVLDFSVKINFAMLISFCLNGYLEFGNLRLFDSTLNLWVIGLLGQLTIVMLQLLEIKGNRS